MVSGHGGYHDFGPGYFNPSYFLECARARDFLKPNWYLPTWYGNTTSDQLRLEQPEQLAEQGDDGVEHVPREPPGLLLREMGRGGTAVLHARYSPTVRKAS